MTIGVELLLGLLKPQAMFKMCRRIDIDVLIKRRLSVDHHYSTGSQYFYPSTYLTLEYLRIPQPDSRFFVNENAPE